MKRAAVFDPHPDLNSAYQEIRTRIYGLIDSWNLANTDTEEDG